jgi:hypothetical protein
MREMHLHALPWPKDVLASLADADATLHVTLSYFIEPGPDRSDGRTSIATLRMAFASM